MEALAAISHIVDEMVILDGESTDGTLEELTWLKSVCPKIKLFSKKHSWKRYFDIAKSENEARNLCKTEYLIRLHLDEVLDIRTIKRIRKFPNINSYKFKVKTLMSCGSTGVARLPEEGIRIFPRKSNICSFKDGYLTGTFEPSANINMIFYHLRWYFPQHWMNRIAVLGPLWNWKGLFDRDRFADRLVFDVDKLSKKQISDKLFLLQISYNKRRNTPPFYLKSLNQFAVYKSRRNVILKILNYKS